MRYLTSYIQEDLKRKMVLVGGPRQCGKTTLAKSILQSYSSGLYLNWDNVKHRNIILQQDWSDHQELLVLDEIHKYKTWKNWLKGTFDTQKDIHKFLVTGSARLDVYHRGGDSMLGRYHYWRLHPFTLSEVPDSKIKHEEIFKRLMNVGGFPEPFLDGGETSARRWRRERMEKVIKDDIREIEGIRNISLMEAFLELLRTRVTGLVVLKNLSEDLQVSQATLKNWLEIFEKMYLVFIVKPYTSNLSRAILKPPKVYFFDNADVEEDEGARFENLVATHLLKTIQFLEDRDGYRYELRYLRDKEGREVDFVILRDKKILELIEVKWSESAVQKSLEYYAEKLKVPLATQIVGQLKQKHVQGKLQVVSPLETLTKLDRYS
jgi:predicted AAA+ superfamily ATPase